MHCKHSAGEENISLASGKPCAPTRGWALARGSLAHLQLLVPLPWAAPRHQQALPEPSLCSDDLAGHYHPPRAASLLRAPAPAPVLPPARPCPLMGTELLRAGMGCWTTSRPPALPIKRSLQSPCQGKLARLWGRGLPVSGVSEKCCVCSSQPLPQHSPGRDLVEWQRQALQGLWGSSPAGPKQAEQEPSASRLTCAGMAAVANSISAANARTLTAALGSSADPSQPRAGPDYACPILPSLPSLQKAFSCSKEQAEPHHTRQEGSTPLSSSYHLPGTC